MFIGVIPARGGSKGLPRKNIRPIAGKPLIEWSIESARNSTRLDQFIVSTDDPEIAAVTESAEARVLMRPSALATDEATTISVLQHVACEFPEAKHFVVLQPTSPLRPAGLIDSCISDYLESGCENLATGYFCKFREFGSHNNARRQDYSGFFYDDGSVYVLSRKLVEEGRWYGANIFKKTIPKEYTFEIDDEIDFAILDLLIKHYQ